MIKKLFILMIKYMPIIQLMGMLLNNTIYYFNVCTELSYILDFILGNSIITTTLLMVCSFAFGFCRYYRLLVIGNFVNIFIAFIDSQFSLPVTDIELLITYYIIACTFLFISLYDYLYKKKMINIKLKILRSLLEECISNIDAGNSNHTEEELESIINSLTKLNRGIKRISKTYACEHILHCSKSSFETYIKLGLIPPGKKEVGFKELSWSEKDFDEATLLRIKKYSSKKGVI